MNHLWLRLTLAFLAVTLITVAVVAVLADWSVNGEFQRYVIEKQTSANIPLPGDKGNVPDFMMHQPAGPARFMHGVMLPPEQAFLARLRQVLVVAALFAGMLGAVLGLAISRTIAAPLANLSHAARDFASHQWDRRVPVEGTNEIADVAQAFNAMAEALQRAEMLRRNMMADIAHELRTPLTVMQGNLRALLDGVYPLEMREVATLYDETRLMSRLVADLRELALAEAGRLPLNLQTIETEAFLKAAVEQFSPAAELQETRIELESSALPPLQADPDRLTQVMQNLLANAVRHTPGGRVVVGGQQVNGQVRIQVSDTGEGIAQADLPYVFDRFYRADSARSGDNTGLGLAIAKAWVEAMGGTIGVENRAGGGSSFWFTVQAVPAAKTA